MIITTIGAFLAYLLNKIKKHFDEKLKEDCINNIVNSTVKYIEQRYNNSKGIDKLNKAKNIVIERLRLKNLLISEFELDVLIESAVNELQRGIDKIDKT